MAVLGIDAPSMSLGKLLAIASLSILGYFLSNVVYNVYFHPLRGFPGPFWMRASRVSYCYHLLRGGLTYRVLELHRRYGEVVRVAPDELVFASAAAWRDLMGNRGPSEPENMKAPQMTGGSLEEEPPSILNADREEHAQLRRNLAGGFSDRGIREHQPVIMKYIDLLIRRLHENVQGGTRPVDAVKWYNYTTFDIIGDLAFGEPFDCLENSEYHPWVSMIFVGIKANIFLGAAYFYPWIKTALIALVPKSLKQTRAEHMSLTREKLLKRMSLGAERPDLMEGLLRKKEEMNLSVHKLQMTSSLLIIAGSETTATALSAVTYLLATHPGPLRRITEEVRSAFGAEDEIDFTAVNRLQYMLACLDEAIRVYPPAPVGLPRQIHKGGANIAGYYVPEDTIVSQHQYALYHWEKFFTAPDEFHPERWLGDPRFATDDRDVFQPFHVGPRNCIGRNLAYVEMRVILARVLWNFDLAIAEDSEDWMRGQKMYVIYEKGPLNVYFKPRVPG